VRNLLVTAFLMVSLNSWATSYWYCNNPAGNGNVFAGNYSTVWSPGCSTRVALNGPEVQTEESVNYGVRRGSNYLLPDLVEMEVGEVKVGYNRVECGEGDLETISHTTESVGEQINLYEGDSVMIDGTYVAVVYCHANSDEPLPRVVTNVRPW
jgi:hypothetical protein